MTVFADSSALVKLYAEEAHADKVRAQELLVVSGVARVEVASALWRKAKTGELSAASASILVDAWDLDWRETGGRFAVVAMTEEVLEGAVGLCARYSLRAYDAIQLASAVAARRAEESVDTFLCFDAELRDAAAREGFTV